MIGLLCRRRRPSKSSTPLAANRASFATPKSARCHRAYLVNVDAMHRQLFWLTPRSIRAQPRAGRPLAGDPPPCPVRRARAPSSSWWASSRIDRVRFFFAGAGLSCAPADSDGRADCCSCPWLQPRLAPPRSAVWLPSALRSVGSGRGPLGWPVDPGLFTRPLVPGNPARSSAFRPSALAGPRRSISVFAPADTAVVLRAGCAHRFRHELPTFACVIAIPSHFRRCPSDRSFSAAA